MGSIRGTVVNTSTAKPSPARALSSYRSARKASSSLTSRKSAAPTGHMSFVRCPWAPSACIWSGLVGTALLTRGSRIQLSESRPSALVELSVCDAVTKPNPLILRRFEITIRPQPGLLRVTESLAIDNPSSPLRGRTADSRRGAQHAATGHSVGFRADHIPEGILRPPLRGRRRQGRHWRPLAAGPTGTRLHLCPAKHAALLALGTAARSALPACDRARGGVEIQSGPVQPAGKSPDDNGMFVFESNGQTLPAGQRLHVELGHLPLAWMSYLRWAVVAAALGLSGGHGGRAGARRKGVRNRFRRAASSENNGS